MPDAGATCVADPQRALAHRTRGRGTTDRRGHGSCFDWRTAARHHLTTGILRNLERDQRLAAIAVCIEIERARVRHRRLNAYRPYQKSDAIFTLGGLDYTAVLNGDLFPCDRLDSIEPLGIARSGAKYFRLDSELSQSSVSLLLGSPTSDRFVRLVPDTAQEDRPLTTLLEATIRPADPQWFAKLRVPRNRVQGSTYIHEDMTLTQETADRYWERYVKGIFKIDFSIKESSGKIFLSVEELCDREIKSDILIGRHIHLDLEASQGQPLLSQTLGHIDLAINIYQGVKAKERIETQLAEGKKVKATSRSHLLRLNGVPATYLFALATTFFHGTHLTFDWIRDVASGLGPSDTP